jgi:hypothetical protein
MAGFDPDAYLASTKSVAPVATGFNPDAYLASTGATGVDAIPVEPGANTQPTPAAQEPSFVDKYIRAPIETAAAVATGMPASVLGQGAGIVASLFGGKYGTQAGVKQAEQTANKVSDYFTYRPRGQAGQELTAQVGNAAQNMMAVPIPLLNDLGKAAPAVTRAIGDNVHAVAATDIPLGATTAQQLATKAVASGNEGAKLDNLAKIRNLGIVVNPNTTNPLFGNKVGAALVGDTDLNRGAVIRNRPVVNSLVRADIGIPEGTALTPKAFGDAKQGFIDVTNDIKAVPKFATDAEYLSGLNDRSFITSLPEGEQALLKNSKQVNALIDKAALPEITGEGAIAIMRELRAKSSKVLNNPSADPAATALANAQRNVAKQIESMIERRLADTGNTELATRFKDERANYAKIKTYEKATTPNGDFMPTKLVSAKNRDAFTGDLKTIVDAAESYPEVFTPPSANGSSLNLTLGGRLNTGLDIVTTPVKKWMLSQKFQDNRASPVDYRSQGMLTGEPQ